MATKRRFRCRGCQKPTDNHWGFCDNCQKKKDQPRGMILNPLELRIKQHRPRLFIWGQLKNFNHYE